MAEILHHLGCMKPYKQWDTLPINWCRISAINSIIYIIWPALAFCWNQYFSYSFQPTKNLSTHLDPRLSEAFLFRTRSINGVSWFQEKLVGSVIFIYCQSSVIINITYIPPTKGNQKQALIPSVLRLVIVTFIQGSGRHIAHVAEPPARVNGHRQGLPSLVGLQNH